MLFLPLTEHDRKIFPLNDVVIQDQQPDRRICAASTELRLDERKSVPIAEKEDQ